MSLFALDAFLCLSAAADDVLTHLPRSNSSRPVRIHCDFPPLSSSLFASSQSRSRSHRATCRCIASFRCRSLSVESACLLGHLCGWRAMLCANSQFHDFRAGQCGAPLGLEKSTFRDFEDPRTAMSASTSTASERIPGSGPGHSRGTNTTSWRSVHFTMSRIKGSALRTRVLMKEHWRDAPFSQVDTQSRRTRPS